ncbi:MAG: respiratory nitrate reductase subunit gamma [Thaumarchaeota archaeon]|nr:respiratory nitrate reductase subunit gamma [Candidatus Geocrenenecus arthurdayi]
MDEYFTIFIGIYLPYITLVVFIVAVIYNFFKWIFLPRPIMWAIFPAKKSLANILFTIATRIFSLPGPRKFDKLIFTLAWMFHIGLIVSLTLHAKYIFIPHLPYEYEVGTIAGMLAAIGSVGFIIRRYVDKRADSYFADYFALILLIITLSLGQYIRMFRVVESTHLWTWVQGILTLNPIPPPVNTLFLIHIVFAQIYMIYLPFKTLIHPIAIFYGQKIILDQRHFKG